MIRLCDSLSNLGPSFRESGTYLDIAHIDTMVTFRSKPRTHLPYLLSPGRNDGDLTLSDGGAFGEERANEFENGFDLAGVEPRLNDQLSLCTAYFGSCSRLREPMQTHSSLRRVSDFQDKELVMIMELTSSMQYSSESLPWKRIGRAGLGNFDHCINPTSRAAGIKRSL